MSIRLVLACDGAAYFDDGSKDYGTFKCHNTFPSKERSHYTDQAELVRMARQSGWRVGPDGDAMCRTCGSPDAHTLRLIDSFGAKQRSGT